jgi:DNA-directed RNA polymerase subunit RPC12/RpoP
MDIIFNCPKCEQELVIDVAGAGSEIECPNCEEKIEIPHAGTKGTRTSGAPASSGNIPSGGGGIPTLPQHGSAMGTSAAAKIEMHLKVPVHDKPVESLIAKPLPPLEVAAKETDKKIRVKTIRHTDCIEVGHDRFDEFVSNFLGKVGEDNVISINAINYTNLDIGSQKLMTEYGVLIVYRG